jgi:hypothetical protein
MQYNYVYFFDTCYIHLPADTLALAPLLRMSNTEVMILPLYTAAQYTVPPVPSEEALTDTVREVRWEVTFSGRLSCVYRIIGVVSVVS